MMSQTDAILCKYSTGEATVEEINKELEAINSNLRLNPNRKQITPENCSYTGLLNSGWGEPDPCVIENMALKYDDMSDAPATCYFMGKRYKVEGKKLVAMEV